MTYLVQTALATYSDGSIVDAGWPASALLIGLAAWQPAKRDVAPNIEGLRVVAVPFVSGLVGVGPLAFDHFDRVNKPALVLTAATVLLVLTRTALVFATTSTCSGAAATRRSPIRSPAFATAAA